MELLVGRNDFEKFSKIKIEICWSRSRCETSRKILSKNNECSWRLEIQHQMVKKVKKSKSGIEIGGKNFFGGQIPQISRNN